MTLVGLQPVTSFVPVAKTLGGQRETTQCKSDAEEKLKERWPSFSSHEINHISADIAIADTEGDLVECLHRILVTSCSLQLKESAAQLCCVLFRNLRVRMTSAASNCIKPLVELLNTDSITGQEASACVLDKLLDDEQQAELVAACGVVSSSCSVNSWYRLSIT
jgi:hypothetical protein